MIENCLHWNESLCAKSPDWRPGLRHPIILHSRCVVPISLLIVKSDLLKAKLGGSGQFGRKVEWFRIISPHFPAGHDLFFLEENFKFWTGKMVIFTGLSIKTKIQSNVQKTKRESKKVLSSWMDLVRKSVSLNFSAWFGRFPIIEKSVAFPGDRGVIRKGCHGPQDEKRKYKLKWKQCQNFPIPIEISCGVSQVPAGHEGGFEDQVGWWVRSGFIWSGVWRGFCWKSLGRLVPINSLCILPTTKNDFLCILAVIGKGRINHNQGLWRYRRQECDCAGRSGHGWQISKSIKYRSPLH